MKSEEEKGWRHKKLLWNTWQCSLSKKAYEDILKEHTSIKNLQIDDETCFGSEIKFGTAGVRDLIGCGFGRLNHATVFAITKGIVNFLRKTSSERLARNGVIIGYDGRRFSRSFATLVACIFKTINKESSTKCCGPIRLFSKVVPTPALAFGTKYYECAIGIMITASHNSKEYNGYKVYDHRSCFIKEPHDAELLHFIHSYLDNDASNEDVLESAKLFNFMESEAESISFIDPYHEILEKFVSAILEATEKNLSLKIKGKDHKTSHISFVYSAMHGCGQNFIDEVFKKSNLKFNFDSVDAQSEPDENFSTVRDPNPEIGYPTLKMTCDLAEKKQYTLGFINDPDADRLAMCEMVNGTWKFFTGNEMAMIYIGNALEFLSNMDPNSRPKANIFNSVVSTVFPRTLCKHLQLEKCVNIEQTLTGFKYLGEKSLEATQQNQQIILSFEESLGFLVADHVYDKDGISACLAFAHLANKLYSEGYTMNSYLISIQEKYGYHLTFNKYYIVQDNKQIIHIMDRIRNWKHKTITNETCRRLEDYPCELGSFKKHSKTTYKVLNVRDLTIGFDSCFSDQKPRLPVNSSNQMITFSCDQDLILTIRASGTEPKIKFYVEKVFNGSIFKDGTYEDYDSAIRSLKDDAINILDELLEPEKNHLIRGY